MRNHIVVVKVRIGHFKLCFQVFQHRQVLLLHHREFNIGGVCVGVVHGVHCCDIVSRVVLCIRQEGTIVVVNRETRIVGGGESESQGVTGGNDIGRVPQTKYTSPDAADIT